eukprot:357019-Pleurochrysis_carterae.AAC.1
MARIHAEMASRASRRASPVHLQRSGESKVSAVALWRPSSIRLMEPAVPLRAIATEDEGLLHRVVRRAITSLLSRHMSDRP